MKSLVLYNRPLNYLHPLNQFSLYDAFTAFDPHPQQTSVQRYPNEYQIELQLSGMKKKDLNIRVEGDVLIIEGKQKEESKRRYCASTFMKRIHLWEDMDVDGIKAKHKNDALTVHIPRKKENVTYREIPVTGNRSVEEATISGESKLNRLNRTLDKVQSWFRKAV